LWRKIGESKKRKEKIVFPLPFPLSLREGNALLLLWLLLLALFSPPRDQRRTLHDLPSRASHSTFREKKGSKLRKFLHTKEEKAEQLKKLKIHPCPRPQCSKLPAPRKSPNTAAEDRVV
jgi:hypothetical protein